MLDQSARELNKACVRLVHTREDDKKVQIREELLRFVQAESITGQALAERAMAWILTACAHRAMMGRQSRQGFTEVSKQLSGIARRALAEGEKPNNLEDTLRSLSECCHRAYHSPLHASVHCYTREIT